MDKTEPVKVFLFTKYTARSYAIIESLLSHGCTLTGVLFSPSSTRRLGVRTYIQNIFTHGNPKDPAQLLRRNKVVHAFTDDHNGANSEQILRASQADILLLYGTKIIKPNILSVPKIGVLNSHSALLPKYRGGKSEFWILYNNEPEYAGVTIHWVVPGLDEGDIFLQRPIQVEHNETPESLRAKSVPITAELFVEAIKRIKKGHSIRIPQDSSQATKYKHPTLEQVKKFGERHAHKSK